ncbi:MAG: hybrid sensor histidine kinase/response regulator [Chloroflexi bacterium CFX4]|nr:hybrid sensor histidine kinase/response regulator [Chloroflexi bacterium CFX4]MDL1923915.1 hybrid sensor histidine kinase/response regulator [Chloroflexi bacterium CFX3]
MMNNRITILYIEDDPGSQVLVERVLGDAGFNVVLASRGLEGLDAAVKHLPNLILMDINLPDMTGREITTRLRADERFRSVPIVALTAQSQGGEREKAIAAGLTGYLTKPIDIDAFPSQVAHYLSGAKDTVSVDALAQAQFEYNSELVMRLEQKVRELEHSNAELRRLDKIKEDFIQLTAHELRTPMTLIYGYSRLIQESAVVKRLKGESPEVKAFIDGLVESIERMSGVINEILTISRIATGRVELAIGPVNLMRTMERVFNDMGQIARQRNQSFTYDARQFPTMVQADSDLLALALANVIGNAIKYTPDGGVINVTARPNTHSVLIAVKDTGIGINKDEQQRIFDRFYTASNTQLHSTSKTAFRGGGLGLGLAICKGIIEAHGGKIWVESEGRDEVRLPGSTFYIDLPLQAPAVRRSTAT